MRECLVGDLNEEYARRQIVEPRGADRWYLREALSLAWYGLRWRCRLERRARSVNGPDAMLRSGHSGSPRGGLRSISPLTDFRHAGRGLRRNPGPVLISAMSLALGIAATTTMVSIIDAIDFRPLPYQDADGLVQLDRTTSTGSHYPPSAELFREWAQRTRSYEGLAAASFIAVAIGDDGDRVLTGSRVTAEFFATLRVSPSLGRIMSPDEVRAGARVAVISHDVWRSEFGGDRSIVGRSVPMSWVGEFRSEAAEPYTIVGVLPPAMRYPRGNDIWLSATDRLGARVTVVGRLGERVSVAAARGELDGVSRQLAIDRPGEYANVTSTVSSIRDAGVEVAEGLGASARFLLLGIAAFVLTLAVINAALVLLVRAGRQKHDLLIRAALGAPKGRLLTLMLAQGLLLSVVAGVVGVLVSYWGIELANARLSVATSGSNAVLDWRAITAGLSVSFGVGVLVGLFPTVSVLRKNVHGGNAMRSAGRASPAGGRLLSALVVAQIACALTLLNGAGVLTRDFVRTTTRDLGFEPERLIVAGLQVGEGPPSNASEIVERLSAVPGVSGAALGGISNRSFDYHLEDGEALSSSGRPRSYRVSADYFATLDIPILAGRAFLASDRTGSTPVAIVNQEAAQRWWPGQMPVGQRLFVQRGDGDREVVTIVGMSRDERVDRDVRWPIEPVLYTPWAQLTDERRRTELFVRTTTAPEPLIDEIRAVVQELRNGQGWGGDYVRTMDEVVGSRVELQRFRASALSLFSLFGLVLASMGVYGVVASVVNERTAEIGIRVALGAQRTNVMALVARDGIGLTLLGLGVGMGGTLLVGRLLESLVLTDGVTDPTTTFAASAVLAMVVLVACYIPSRRASRIDPARALRES